MNNELENIQWTTLEHGHHDRSPDWFWGLGVLILVGSIGSFIAGNALLGVLILIAGFTLFLFAIKKPRVLSCTITPRGIMIGTETHSYKTLRSFWVRDEEGNKQLLLDCRKVFVPHIAIPIPEEKEAVIKNYLGKYLPEDEHSEPLAHVIIRCMKL